MIEQPDPKLQAAMMAEAQLRAKKESVENLIYATAIEVYGQLIAASIDRSPEACRAHAATAKATAPYLAESYGMVTVGVEKSG